MKDANKMVEEAEEYINILHSWTKIPKEVFLMRLMKRFGFEIKELKEKVR